MYFIDKLNNGTRVVMEKIPYVNSVSIGVFVNTGSINEDKNQNGISHFIEHMLFKGTLGRTGKEIAQTIDNIGGQINAFTEKECTCFYVRVLDKHLLTAIDILSDMINNPKFSDYDIENEKKVILEEIKMYLDSPEDLVYDLLDEIMFNGTPLSLPILGTKKTLLNLNKDIILKYYRKHYIPQNMVISIAGNFNPSETLNMLNYYFNMESKCCNTDKLYNNVPRFEQKLKGKKKDIEQLNFCLGMEGVKRGDENLYSLLVVNNVFGGSISSRLFQKIREDKGLAYSIYSNSSSFQNTGIFAIYAALGENEILNVAELINREIKEIKKNLIDEYELSKSKEQLKSNYMLGMEDTLSRMIELGETELFLNRILSPEEILNRIDKIKMEDIEKIISKVFDKNKYNIAYVGNLDNNEDIDKKLKEIFFN